MAVGDRLAREAFVPEREAVTGDRIKLHSEELHVICWSPSNNSDCK